MKFANLDFNWFLSCKTTFIYSEPVLWFQISIVTVNFKNVVKSSAEMARKKVENIKKKWARTDFSDCLMTLQLLWLVFWFAYFFYIFLWIFFCIATDSFFHGKMSCWTQMTIEMALKIFYWKLFSAKKLANWYPKVYCLSFVSFQNLLERRKFLK